ncbi:AAA family ATPase [Microbacterium sp. SLBN-146]|uniref:AAA family ATPase n=1 Tax=Microbacterium sp. SLBN-146 TaxID=2768457 RepID=UPI0011545142|nr:AAA family ATPase [Microbacterium sp. SLBN-146]TQJ32449.1 putative ATPase [Microbacterium sp. SLBN-146]
MLTTVAVSGYRSIRDLVVPLGRLTVITGPNGSGKSNLYRALRLLSQSARGALISAVAREGGLSSLLWAGPENGGTEGTMRTRPRAVQLGFASDELGYLVDLGIPQAAAGSPFSLDPEIKREQIFAGPIAKPATLLLDRLRGVARVRDDAWKIVDQSLAPYESIITDLAAGDTAPELLALRRTFGGWRFYDHFRVDVDAPVRQPQIGTRTPTLSHSGDDLAAVWATIQDAGHGAALAEAVAGAFPGAVVQAAPVDGRLRLTMRQPGLLRPLDSAELSDGTLRYLLLCAALLPARPAPLIVLNEPEASLHPGLLEPLADLIDAASADAQVVVVTHADALATALERSGATTHRLRAGSAGTVVDGQGVLDRPAWNWGSR